MTPTRWLLIISLTVCCAVAQTRTKNVILVTADGLRWQELFTGIDPMLMDEKVAGMDKADALRKKLWRETPTERRAALMPFFWTKLASTGIVFGNVGRKSSVQVSNAYRVSYPGYSEILTGRAQDDVIRGNAEIRNPVPTVLEFLRSKLKLRQSEVALFASWEVFRWIGEHEPGTITINAGNQSAEGSPRMKELSALQFQARPPWDGMRHDYVTLEMALDYMSREKPRVTYISLGESDDWAHDKRYDRTLEAIEYFDEALRRISEFTQTTAGYRGNTTLVIAVDHGRGSTLQDWTSHGAKVAGAEQIWLAVFGPDTPAVGEAANTEPIFQRDITPTILDLMGIDYREYKGILGKPVKAAKK